MAWSELGQVDELRPVVHHGRTLSPTQFGGHSGHSPKHQRRTPSAELGMRSDPTRTR